MDPGGRMMRIGIAVCILSACVFALAFFGNSTYASSASPERPLRQQISAEDSTQDEAIELHPLQTRAEDNTQDKAIELHTLQTRTEDDMQDKAVDRAFRVVPSFNDTVAKTVYSSKLRLIFIVGLEGTGHHYLADVLDHLCETSHVSCPKTCKMGVALYPGLGNPKTANDYRTARESLRREMKRLAAAADELEDGMAAMASFGKCRFDAVGMMSYPNFNGAGKALQYVDFRILAEEAELAGVDLRLVYLSRPAQDIVISDTKHNRYGDTFILETRSLVANADVVANTFRELGSGFTTCFFYDEISSSKQAERVASFLAPTQYAEESLMQGMLRAVKLRPTAGEKASIYDKYPDITDPESGQGLLVARLQQKLDAIEEEHCRGF